VQQWITGELQDRAIERSLEEREEPVFYAGQAMRNHPPPSRSSDQNATVDVPAEEISLSPLLAAGNRRAAHFGVGRSQFCLPQLCPFTEAYWIREAAYATIFIMSSIVRLATTGFISSVHLPLRKPCCMSYIWRIR
jgi:hypothetical protein